MGTLLHVRRAITDDSWKILVKSACDDTDPIGIPGSIVQNLLDIPLAAGVDILLEHEDQGVRKQRVLPDT